VNKLGRSYFRLTTLEITLTRCGIQLKIIVIFQKKRLRAIIDSKATKNFISLKAALRIKLKDKQDPYLLLLVDKNKKQDNSKIVRKETMPSQIIFKTHVEEIILEVTLLGNYKAILGML
jgi:hypothetical protein